MLTNSISKTQRASSLHTSSNIFDLSFLLPLESESGIELSEVLFSEVFKACNDPLAGELLNGFDIGSFWYLDLESAFAKAQSQFFGNVVLHTGLDDYIVSSNTEVDVTLSNEGWYVRGGEEDTGE